MALTGDGMNWLLDLPYAVFTLFVFAFGLTVGSFLNVMAARLPFEKSVIWPGSRCFTCLQPLRFADNLPIVGYLRLRGRCRNCGATFSSRYLWMELFTGLAFVALYIVEILLNVNDVPGLRNAAIGGLPSLAAWGVFFVHSFLLAMLIAASIIDLDYKIVPPQITIPGTVIGLIASTLLPWPWPSDLFDLPWTMKQFPWNHPANNGVIPTGLTLWPVWQPPTWAPAGSWQLGLLSGLAGAAAGQFIGRAVKYLFEMGFGKEALGIGDADLLMMAGAFLGWQPISLAFFVGALVLLPLVLILKAVAMIRRTPPGSDPQIPFGPGIAAGIVICWLGWKAPPHFGELVQTIYFDGIFLGALVIVLGGGLLAAGTIITLVRGAPEEPP